MSARPVNEFHTIHTFVTGIICTLWRARGHQQHRKKIMLFSMSLQSTQKKIFCTTIEYIIHTSWLGIFYFVTRCRRFWMQAMNTQKNKNYAAMETMYIYGSAFFKTFKKFAPIRICGFFCRRLTNHIKLYFASKFSVAHTAHRQKLHTHTHTRRTYSRLHIHSNTSTVYETHTRWINA